MQVFSSDAEEDALAPQRPARPWLPLALLLLVLGSGLFMLVLVMRSTETATRDGRQHPATGRRLPDWSLNPLTDAEAALPADRGKVSLVNFWGPWCMYCRVEFPELIALQREFAAHEDFQFVSVSCPFGRGESLDSLRAQSQQFLRESEAPFAAYADLQSAYRNRLLTILGEPDFVFPTTIVADRAGTIRGVWLGFVEGDMQNVAAVVREVLEAPAEP